MDELLRKHNLTFDELKADERSMLLAMVNVSQNSQLTVERIQSYISQLKGLVEQELADKKDTPQNWVSILVLLIPLVGIIRKWYQDQRTVYLQARLRNLVLLSDVISRPDKAKAELEASIATLAQNIQSQKGMRGGGI